MSKIKEQISHDYYGYTDSTDMDIDPMEMPVGDLFDDDTYWVGAEDGE